MKLLICNECGKMSGAIRYKKRLQCPYCNYFKLELFEKERHIISPAHTQFSLLKRLLNGGKIQIGDRKK